MQRKKQGVIFQITDFTEHELNFRLMLHLFPLETKEIINFTENKELIETHLFPIFKQRGSLQYFLTEIWEKKFTPRYTCELILEYVYGELI